MASGRNKICLVGGNGILEDELFTELERREVTFDGIRLLTTSLEAAGEPTAGDGRVDTASLSEEEIRGADAVIFLGPPEIAREWIPCARKSAGLVLDASGASRGELGVPVYVNDEQGGEPKRAPRAGLYILPSRAAEILGTILRALNHFVRIRRIVVSTYQGADEFGKSGMETLSREVLNLYRKGHLGADVADDEEEALSPFPKQIAFNAIPQVGPFGLDGKLELEQSLPREVAAVVGVETIDISSTCVCVPWFSSLAMSVNLQSREQWSPLSARACLAATSGIVVEDLPDKGLYPTPFPHAGDETIFVGRVRRDDSVAFGLNFWCVADGLRREAMNLAAILEQWAKD